MQPSPLQDAAALPAVHAPAPLPTVAIAEVPAVLDTNASSETSATPETSDDPAAPDTAGPETRGRVEFVHRSWPADPAQLSVIRRELAGWLAPLALTEDEMAEVVLAVDEAAANAVRHAYGPGGTGVVELTLWTEPGTLCVEVVDHGNWRPPATPTPRGEAGDSGRGLTLMSSMADAVLIHFDARGSRVLLRHRVPDAVGWLEPEATAAGAPVPAAAADDDPHAPTTPVSPA